MGLLHRTRALLTRLGLIVLGLVLALVLMELVLQLGALYTWATGRAQPLAWVTDQKRVICLGDSNTHGLWVESPKAYPRQVQELWNANEPARFSPIRPRVPGIAR